MRRPGLLRTAASALVPAILLGGCTGEGTASGATSAGSIGAASRSGPTGEGALPATSTVAAAVRQLATDRWSALMALDDAGWLHGLSADEVLRTSQQSQAEILHALPLQLASGAPVTVSDVTPQADGTFVAHVVVRYRFLGYDRADRDAGELWRLRRGTDGTVTILAVTAPQDGAAPWLLPGAHVVATSDALVIGNRAQQDLQTLAGQAAAARRAVTSAWGSCPPVVIVAPATDEQAREQLDTAVGSTTGIAARTTGEIGGGATSGADRVVLMPTGFFAGLTEDGRRAVLTHEATHVAVRASTSGSVPMWLSEGYADTVGFGILDRTRASLAPEVVAEVRAGAIPAGLPSDADLTGPVAATASPTPQTDATTPTTPTTSADVGVRAGSAPVMDRELAYEQSWLFVARLQDHLGAQRLVAVYQAAAQGTGGLTPADPAETRVAQAFVDVLGTTQAQAVTGWQAYLAEVGRS